MTVVDKNKIDFMYVEDDKIILEILDDLNWENENLTSHWELIVSKIKKYMSFIHTGQLKENIKKKYNDDNLKPCIKIVFLHQWPQVVEKYLNNLEEINIEYNCELKWEYNPKYIK